jgi:cytochrome bd ubiquinol oxidase subunit I
LTLVLYVALYLALIVSYVLVLKYMAEKPDELGADAGVEALRSTPELRTQLTGATA